ncbi:MAG: CapA family protein [Eubacterium sp.]|nr:CapA family protein [Eubacterium sp.]
MKKVVFVLSLILGCIAMGFGGFYLARYRMTENIQTVAQASTPPIAPPQVVSGDAVGTGGAADITEITFSASGDNLIHSYIYNQARERTNDGSYDFSFAYEKVAKLFNKTDINWINQETLVTDTLEPDTFPTFSTPGDVARALYDINFRIFNISTNHTYDQGADGLTQSVKFWKSMPDVLATGLVKGEKYENIPIYEKEGVKFAFLSYTYGTNGLTVPEDSKYHVILLSQKDVIRSQMKLARELADVVVVSCHWGNEDSHTVTDEQRSTAKMLTRLGADLIIGTHPHVVQDAEWVEAKGRRAFCAYSLGNFISGQSIADNLIGVTLTLTFEVHEDLLNDTFRVIIKDPKLIPNITDYRSSHADLRVFWLKNYTRDLADTHGVRGYDSRFSYDYIFSVLKDNISSEFLKLPKKKKS